MLKFLHIGDVHLDTSFYSKSEELRRKLREGIREALRNAVDLCINEKVNGLLIAGDLFDNDRLSFRTEQFLLNQFDRLNWHGIKVFYATGNHDPGHISYRVNFIRWPENVYVFKEDKPEVVDILNSDGNSICKIVSCGHKTKNEGRNLIDIFPVKERNIPHIGLVHTMVTNAKGVNEHDRYLPCTKEDLECKKYDYWALGHIHTRQKISDGFEIYYPGNIQGRNPREMGEKGGLLVTIDDYHNITTEFRTLSSIQWNTLRIKGLESIRNYDEMKSHLRESIEKYIESNRLCSNSLILRVELEGRAFLKSELQSESNINHIIEDLMLDLNLLDLEFKTDMLMNTYNINEYKEGNHVLSLTLNLLENLENNDELIKILLNMPLANQNVKEIKQKINYFNELLKDLDEEAVSRMAGDFSEGN